MVESKVIFDANVLRKWIMQEIEKKYACKRRKVTIISHEELSGHPHGYKIIDPITNAHHLKNAFPNAKILIIIRNQFDYLTSIYSFRVVLKGQESRSFKRFLLEEEKKGIVDHLEYHRLIEDYIKLFGKERVLILPMEYLKISPNVFSDLLSSFVGVPVKLSMKNRPKNVSTKLLYVLSIWRLINYIFNSLLIAILYLTGEDYSKFEPTINKEYYNFIKLRYAYYAFKRKSTKLLNKVFYGTRKVNIESYSNYHILVERFGESNARLENLMSCNLDKLFYPVKK